MVGGRHVAGGRSGSVGVLLRPPRQPPNRAGNRARVWSVMRGDRRRAGHPPRFPVAFRLQAESIWCSSSATFQLHTRCPMSRSALVTSITVLRDSPDVLATNVVPPRPNRRAIAPLTRRRCFSSRCGNTNSKNPSRFYGSISTAKALRALRDEAWGRAGVRPGS